MILMSRDFATPFLKQDPTKLDTDDVLKTSRIFSEMQDGRVIRHPYIFFNPDKHTMTLLGFHISNTGHLTDSENPSNVIRR